MHNSLISFGNITAQIHKYYLNNGTSPGLSTGWREVDKYFLLQKGTLNIITGIPSSGKSEWLDQLMLNTIALHNWHWTVFSPENWPLPHHFQKLSEKWVGKPMFQGYNIPQMSLDDVNSTISQLGGSIHFLNPPDGEITIDPILDILDKSREEYSTDAFILDPWNELEHTFGKYQNETMYIGSSLTKIRNFARRKNIAMFIVAHPTKLFRKDDGSYPVPTPYDISGSANWRNKADSCISVWRDYQTDNGNVDIHFQKMRNKNLGKMGCATLHWCRANGIFFDYEEELKNHESHGICKKQA